MYKVSRMQGSTRTPRALERQRPAAIPHDDKSPRDIRDRAGCDVTSLTLAGVSKMTDHGNSYLTRSLIATYSCLAGLLYAGSAKSIVLVGPSCADVFPARAITASRDHGPGPAMSRNRTLMTCAYSDRISCRTAHMPIWGGAGGSGSGDTPRYRATLVVRIATIISMMNGIEMNLVRRPVMRRTPPTISSMATKCAVG